ncbi:MAG: chemotaxis protein CheA [Gemmatimonadetes bacterium]|nr:chemotaxis protein CheA [Gemmatimonadota bacterium]
MDLAQYAELFLAEAREHLAAVNDLLLAWERDPTSREPLGGIFRAVHTIKGMAATMGYTSVADLAHRMENVLDGLRRTEQAPSGETLELLFRTADGLESGVNAAVAGRESAATADLASALERAAAAYQPARRAGQPRAPEAAAEPRPGGAAPGVPVRVTLQPDAALKGPRALVVLARARELGAVEGVHPPPAAFEREDFDGAVSFRLDTQASAEVIEAKLRQAGDVARVSVGAAADLERRAEPGTGARHVRVDLRRLDGLMNLMGELLTAREHLLEVASRQADVALEDVSRRVSQLTTQLQDQILQARMTPVWQVFDRFPRLVRDLARRLGKQVEFVIDGKDIELDRALLDEISDPLVHLLRNAVDHGLEPPEERLAAGKPAMGRVTLAAARERDTVAVRVADDGRGIDRLRVLGAAKARGLIDSEAEISGDEALIRVLARPGFSTAAQVSDVSGRGVGIDVVVTKVRALGGAVELRTARGQGATFTLRLPTSLAIVRALVTRVGEERYAVPLTHVAETVDLDPRRVTTLEGRDALAFHDRLIPLVHLRRVLQIDGEPPARRPVVVVAVGERYSGLVVDAMLGQQEIMVKPFTPPAGTLPIFTGATILGDGAPVLIFDAGGLV